MRNYGVKYGGVIYLTNDRAKAQEKATSFGKAFHGGPIAFVEAVDRDLLRILVKDGFNLYDLDCPPRHIHSLRDGGVYDVQIPAHSNERVFWNTRHDRYTTIVIAANPRGRWTACGKRVSLLSVSGSGEIRWDITPDMLEWDGPDGEEAKVASEYFGLTPVG